MTGHRPGRRAPAARLAGLVALVLAPALASCSTGPGAAGRPAALPTTATTAAPATTAPPPPRTTVTAARPPAGTAVPAGPSDPAGTARELAATETAVRDHATSDAALPSLALREQLAYRALIAHPDWDAAVAALLPAPVRPIVADNVAAGRELGALASPRQSLPPWRIVAPALAPTLLGYYQEAERRFGVPWAYLAAIHLVETRMGRIRGLSSAGARGPMQFMPATWAAYGGGGDVDSDHDSILAAARYLRANGAPGAMAGALFAYNRSTHYVRAITLYAEQMRHDPRAYLGYYHWQVLYLTAGGEVLLPVGWVGPGA